MAASRHVCGPLNKQSISVDNTQLLASSSCCLLNSDVDKPEGDRILINVLNKSNYVSKI